jgi:hypothetical protein
MRSSKLKGMRPDSSIGGVVPDHAHILVEADILHPKAPWDDLGDIVQAIQDITSERIFQAIPDGRVPCTLAPLHLSTIEAGLRTRKRYSPFPEACTEPRPEPFDFAQGTRWLQCRVSFHASWYPPGHENCPDAPGQERKEIRNPQFAIQSGHPHPPGAIGPARQRNPQSAIRNPDGSPNPCPPLTSLTPTPT